MVKINPKDLKYYHSLNLNIIVKQKGAVIEAGVLAPKTLEQYLGNPECEFYVKRSKTHRFYKYLTGQIFIGYFCTYVFGAIALMFAALALYSMNLSVAAFTVGTGVIALVNYKIARKAHLRLLRSLNKTKSLKS